MLTQLKAHFELPSGRINFKEINKTYMYIFYFLASRFSCLSNITYSDSIQPYMNYQVTGKAN